MVSAGARACRDVGMLSVSPNRDLEVSWLSLRSGEDRTRSLAASFDGDDRAGGRGEVGGLESRMRGRLLEALRLREVSEDEVTMCGCADEVGGGERASRETSSSEMSSSKVLGEPGLIRSSSSSSSSGERVSASRRVAGIPVAPNWCILQKKEERQKHISISYSWLKSYSSKNTNYNL